MCMDESVIFLEDERSLKIAAVDSSHDPEDNVRNLMTRASVIHFDNLPVESKAQLKRSQRSVVMKVGSPHYYRPETPKYHKNIAYPTTGKNPRRSKAKFHVHKRVNYKTNKYTPKYKLNDPAGFGEPPISIYQNKPRIQGFGEPPVEPIGSHSSNLAQPSNKYKDNNRGNILTDESRPPALAHTSQFYGKRNKKTVMTNYRNPSLGKTWYGKDDKYRKRNKPWFPRNEASIVGGQYAEPPARYVTKSRQPAFEDKISHPSLVASDSDASASNAVSSYTNYKSSNLAFSPQNLNDAFGSFDTR